MESLDYYMNNPSSVIDAEPAIHFYAAAISHSKDKEQLLAKVTKLQTEYTGLSKTVLQRINNETEYFVPAAAVSGKSFDLLLAEFMAIGDEEPMIKIANFLWLSDEKDKKAIVQLITAEWSLASNAEQHKAVYKKFVLTKWTAIL